MQQSTAKPAEPQTHRVQYAVCVTYSNGSQRLYNGGYGRVWAKDAPEGLKLMTQLARAANIHRVQWTKLEPAEAWLIQQAPSIIEEVRP